MGTRMKQNVEKRIAHGRPPTFHRSKTLSSKATKAVINRHHVLEKRKNQATLRNDWTAVKAFEAEINANGGIQAYQQASLQGQGKDRGGDTSKVLMEWLVDVAGTLRAHPARMLEVGALSSSNACSRSGCFSMQRIDLNSHGDGILQQDFMARPFPEDDSERFDIISLSLVLNFVPDAWDRGKMLWRTLAFLKDVHVSELPSDSFFPSLFLVLPGPCVLNSRYTDEGRLGSIMKSLGFALAKSRITNKLVYYLWKRVPCSIEADVSLGKKKEVRPGSTRNNFLILLDPCWPGWPMTAQPGTHTIHLKSPSTNSTSPY